MRFHAQKFFFNCVLLFLLLEDDMGAERKLEKYKDDDASLANSYEAKFLDSIINDFKEKNEESFSNNCYQLNSRKTLDKRLTSILAEIKKKMKSGAIEEQDFDPF